MTTSRNLKTNEELVEYLVKTDKIQNDKVEKAFRKVDRKNFIENGKPYSDKPQTIGSEVTISAPHMVAINTELLEVKETDHVLELGSGSGYQLAILSNLAANVTGIERIKRLANLSKTRLEDKSNVTIIHGDGLNEVNKKFDKILYSFSIDREEFKRAQKYLREKGILLAPLKKNNYQVMTKYQNGTTEEHIRVRFVPQKEGAE